MQNAKVMLSPKVVNLEALQLAKKNYKWQHAFVRAGFKPLTVKVGFALLGYINTETGIAWMWQKTLAEVCNCSEKAVCRAVKEICDGGFLDKWKPRLEGPLNYSLRLPGPDRKGLDCPVRESSNVTALSSRKARHDHLEKDKTITSKRTVRSHHIELSNEPSNEPSKEPIDKKISTNPSLTLGKDAQLESPSSKQKPEQEKAAFIEAVANADSDPIPEPTAEQLSKVPEGALPWQGEPIKEYLEGAITRIGCMGCGWLGLGAEHRLADGRMPDRALLQHLPIGVVAALARAMKGGLPRDRLARTLVAFNLVPGINQEALALTHAQKAWADSYVPSTPPDDLYTPDVDEAAQLFGVR